MYDKSQGFPWLFFMIFFFLTASIEKYPMNLLAKSLLKVYKKDKGSLFMARQMLPETEEKSITEASVEPAVEIPKQYQVVLCNDDYTPMEFVVEVIQHFFHVSEDVAVRLMMQVHVEGRAVCGTFSRDVAETIVGLVNEYARLNEYPLMSVMEVI